MIHDKILTPISGATRGLSKSPSLAKFGLKIVEGSSILCSMPPWRPFFERPPGGRVLSVGPKNRVWGQTRAPSPACCGTLGGIRQLPAAWGAFYVLALITDNGPSETRVVRRSQARGRMASQPHTNHHARAKADRQTDRTGSNPHTDQTPQRESPPPKDTPWCPRTGPRTREALLCAAPHHTALSSSNSSSSVD